MQSMKMGAPNRSSLLVAVFFASKLSIRLPFFVARKACQPRNNWMFFSARTTFSRSGPATSLTTERFWPHTVIPISGLALPPSTGRFWMNVT